MGRNEIGAKAARELAAIPGFAGCTKRQLAQVDRLTDRIEAVPGQMLVREGGLGREAYVIISGSATVTRRGRLITTLGPGDYFGELAAIDTGRRDATLTAMSTLEVLSIGPREFTTLLADIQAFRDVLLRGMARNLRAANDTIETMRIVFQDAPMAPAGR
ncbi:MAG TPA: cyclic nucleotide-binding domain-containing protein [Acidimicrobiales bacterium]|jgi:CRP-like cAMP-binding protein|nr:cyclic nucleotide-binding domain-containing protein [Acidimicrobiales bacterium]